MKRLVTFILSTIISIGIQADDVFDAQSTLDELMASFELSSQDKNKFEGLWNRVIDFEEKLDRSFNKNNYSVGDKYEMHSLEEVNELRNIKKQSHAYYQFLFSIVRSFGIKLKDLNTFAEICNNKMQINKREKKINGFEIYEVAYLGRKICYIYNNSNVNKKVKVTGYKKSGQSTYKHSVDCYIMRNEMRIFSSNLMKNTYSLPTNIVILNDSQKF